MSRLPLTLILALFAVALTVPAAHAAPDRKPPRIKAAQLIDADGDARADRVRLTYSERVRHARDADRRYPFRVTGYKVSAVAAARARAVVLTLVERPAADPDATASVVYRRTKSRPVKDRAGNQAVAQTYRAVVPHRRRPVDTPPVQVLQDPTPDPFAGDGDPLPAAYCALGVKPGVADLPDLAFQDTNCDGIDGTETNAIFVSPNGDDTNPGTRARPMREIDAAVAVATTGKYVLAAAGAYKRVTAKTGVGIYGGYDPRTWARGVAQKTFIVGAPEGIYADGAKNVVVELLEVSGDLPVLHLPGGMSFYGLRAVGGSELTLRRVIAKGGTATDGEGGLFGNPGRPGSEGGEGGDGQCGGGKRGTGGAAGDSPSGRLGGAGGRGGGTAFGFGGTGDDGLPGVGDAPGGPGAPPATPAATVARASPASSAPRARTASAAPPRSRLPARSGRAPTAPTAAPASPASAAAVAVAAAARSATSATTAPATAAAAVVAAARAASPATRAAPAAGRSASTCTTRP